MVVKISNYYVTYLCCWVYCFNLVLDVVAGVLVVAGVVDHGRGDIDGGVGGPSGDSSTTGRMLPLLLVVDDDVPVRLG